MSAEIPALNPSATEKRYDGQDLAKQIGLVDGHFIVRRSGGTEEAGWRVLELRVKSRSGIDVPVAVITKDVEEVINGEVGYPMKTIPVSELLNWQANDDTVPRVEMERLINDHGLSEEIGASAVESALVEVQPIEAAEREQDFIVTGMAQQAEEIGTTFGQAAYMVMQGEMGYLPDASTRLQAESSTEFLSRDVLAIAQDIQGTGILMDPGVQAALREAMDIPLLGANQWQGNKVDWASESSIIKGLEQLQALLIDPSNPAKLGVNYTGERDDYQRHIAYGTLNSAERMSHALASLLMASSRSEKATGAVKAQRSYIQNNMALANHVYGLLQEAKARHYSQ